MSTTSSTSAATTTTGSTTSIATVITDAGFAMLRAAPGHKLVYTRAVCGSGHVDKTQLATLTEVSDYVMDLSIVEFGPSESSATLRLQLDNSKAPKEFQLHQIGVCAKLLDGEEELIGETLIQVMQYEEPDIVRAVPHVSEFIVNVLVGQAEIVEGVIDMAAYVSIRQFSGRTVNGKPLSADVTLTGADIQVSGDDSTAISTALSNKVTITGNNMAGLDCNNFISDGRYQCQGEVLNSPPWHPGSGYGHFFVDVYNHADSWIVQVAHAVDHIGSFIRHCIGGTWQEWEKIATATPPQGYDLPLEIGWDVYGICKYWLTQDGMCFVNIGAHATSPPSTEQVVLATLPEGFRPNANVYAPACVSFPRAPGDLQINPSGQIIYTWATLENETYISAFFGFLVNQ